jgi:hypothetical protein
MKDDAILFKRTNAAKTALHVLEHSSDGLQQAHYQFYDFLNNLLSLKMDVNVPTISDKKNIKSNRLFLLESP